MSPDSADLLVSGVRRVLQTVPWDYLGTEMAMGSDSPAESRSGVDFNVQLQVSWNAPEAHVNLDSDGIYQLKSVPDVLDLHAWQPGAAVIKVLLGRDIRSGRSLVPDVKVRDRGFHKITLLNMGDQTYLWLIYLYSICSGQYMLCPVCPGCSRSWNKCVTSAKSGIAAVRPTGARSVGRRLSWTCADTFPTTTWNSRSYGAARCRGAPYDCMDHLRLAHAVPASVKTANLDYGFYRGLSSIRRGVMR